MLVQDISYVQALKSIRELVLDTGLVQSFKVSGQDFVFKKTPEEVRVNETIKDIRDPNGEFNKLYDLIALLTEKEIKVEILPDYVATEYIQGLLDFSVGVIPEPEEPETPEIPEEEDEPVIEDLLFDLEDETPIEEEPEPVLLEHTVKAKNYFSDSVIENTMIEFFSYYIPYDGRERMTQEIFDNMSYFQKRKMILWVAFYLVDRRRMQMTATKMIIDRENGGDVCGSSDLKNTKLDITTRVGDVYTEVEREDENGSGLDGFTSLWGDRYSYLTKLQLYLRGRFEKMFNDFSLRDDAMISQSFIMEKSWQNDAWIDTHGWSYDTLGVLVENRD